MDKTLRYFIELEGDGYTCTSTLEKNEEGLYEFQWESDFQSGAVEHADWKNHMLEITKEEYDMIQMTIDNEELLDYQFSVKEYVIAKYNEEVMVKNEEEKEFLQFIQENEGLHYYQAAMEQMIDISNNEKVQNALETIKEYIEEKTRS